MENSYHALQGSFYQTGDNWKKAVKEKFIAAYRNNSSFTVQFSTETDFELCKDALESLFREAAREAGITKWSWTATYVSQYHLIHIAIK